MRLNAILIVLTALLAGTGACAGETLEYDVTGVFADYVPDTPWSAPNEPFELRFFMDSQPIPASINLIGFTVPTSVSYTIGSGPELNQSVEAEFFGPYFPLGGLSFAFNASQPPELFQLGWGGDHLFTGTLDGPVMDTGTFHLNGAALTVSPVPEPSLAAACAVILIGLIVLVGRRVETNY